MESNLANEYEKLENEAIQLASMKRELMAKLHDLEKQEVELKELIKQ